MPNSRRPTLTEVARLAGVSHMTVSRVVSGSGSVSKATETKVRAAITELGYRPDPALSALASYRRNWKSKSSDNPIAFFDCDGTVFTQSVREGAAAEIRMLGYSFQPYRLPANESGQKQLSRTLFHRGVRGLLFGPSDDLIEFQGWKWEEFACVSLGAITHRPAMHAVSMDYFHAAQSGVGRLKEAGCRRVALVVEPKLEARTGHRWLGGFRASAEGDWVYNWDGHPELLATWIQENQIEGILTIHAEARSNLPESVRCIYLNEIAGASAPRYRLDPARIGSEGVRILHHLLLRHEFGIPDEPKLVSLQGSWDWLI